MQDKIIGELSDNDSNTSGESWDPPVSPCVPHIQPLLSPRLSDQPSCSYTNQSSSNGANQSR